MHYNNNYQFCAKVVFVRSAGYVHIICVCDVGLHSNTASLYLHRHGPLLLTATAQRLSTVGLVGCINTYNQHADRNWQTIVVR
jgi:hypothetical protein